MRPGSLAVFVETNPDAIEIIDEGEEKFYSEDQPREPAGVPEGGQWVEYDNGPDVSKLPSENAAERVEKSLAEKGFSERAIRHMISATDEYMGTAHEEMNRALKGKIEGSARTWRQIDSMQRLLANLPALKGGTLWRGAGLRDKDLAKIKPGATFRTRTFFSTSTSRFEAENFKKGEGGRSEVVFEVKKHDSAIPVTFLNSSEKECIFAPGARFHIDKVEIRRHRDDWSDKMVATYHVKMREIPRKK